MIYGPAATLNEPTLNANELHSAGLFLIVDSLLMFNFVEMLPEVEINPCFIGGAGFQSVYHVFIWLK